DGGKDGSLDFADNRLAQGYAVANSNTGHDNGSEPRATFADEDLAALIDFGHRAVHLTANASKTVARAYYRTAPRFTYFEGCSTGGREGLMEAQRYPDDFDGIFAGNLAFDKDNDGVPESLTKLHILRDAVLAKCDTKDGIKDGVIDYPPSC